MDNFRRTLENKSEEFLAATRTPFLSYCYSRDYQSKRFAAFLATSDVDVRADLTLKQTRDCFVPASGHMPSHTQKVTLTEAMATANLNQFPSKETLGDKVKKVFFATAHRPLQPLVSHVEPRAMQ